MEHENEFLNTFFTNLSHQCFDKAKEHVEKEKELYRSAQPTPWIMLLNNLPQVIFAEKSYIELGCLTIKNKGFLRKENSLRAIYDALRTDMKRLEDVIKLNQVEVENCTGNEKPLVTHIAEFLTARMDLIDWYEKLFQLGNAKQVKYFGVYSQIQSILNKHTTTFTHISLMPIKAVVMLEMEVLYNLIGALQELQALQFIPSITYLYGAHTRLTVLETSLQNRETWKLGFTASFLKNNPHPLLFQWMVKLKAAALSKFSLYFYFTLAQQTTSNEMRQLCAKQNVDYFNKIQAFQRRHDALVVSLLYDNRGLDPLTEDTAEFTIIVSCPVKPVTYLMEHFSMTVTERNNEIERGPYLFITKENNTFVISKVEPRVYLMLIFDSRRSEKETYICNFITEICTQLRFTKNFLSLKISSK